MKITKMAVYLSVFIASVLSAAHFPADNSWLNNVRPEHPRMIFTKDNLPLVREQIKTIRKKEFENLQRSVAALPAVPAVKMRQGMVTPKPDGTYKVTPAALQAQRLFEPNPAKAANETALMFLLTGDKQYARLAHGWLKESLKILEASEKYQIWADWQGDSRINMILAYDWICNELSAAERKEIMLPILDYLTNARGNGKFKFRRTISSPKSGNYGENSMLLFAGFAAYKDGIDDARAEEMLRYGVKLYTDMLDYRDKLSAGSGLLTSSTVTYSFGAYPYASFFFFHLWKSAIGEDVAGRWQQMCDFPNWYDFASIDIDSRGRILYHGIGDLAHEANRYKTHAIYTHLAQTVHFYGKIRPERMANTWAVLKRLPKSLQVFAREYTFLPFALTGFDPAEIAADHPQVTPPAYFYNPGYGLLLMRSGTGPADTYAAFRFGGKQFNHQHYDELSFVIYKKGFLAVDSGTRCSTAQHHNYAAQTVAHNSILIHQENEPVAPFWKPWGFQKDNTPVMNHGGQNSVGNAKELALHSHKDFIYAAGDATMCYSKEKCKEAIRQFVYLKPDTFVIFDRVESVRADQKKEVLFHALNEPVKEADKRYRFDDANSLFIQTILPEKAISTVVGGPGKEFWASGRNWLPEGGKNWDKKYRLTGKWRVEVADNAKQTRSEFLHVLHAADLRGKNSTSTGGTTAEKAWVEIKELNGSIWHLEFARKGPVDLQITRKTPDGKTVYSKHCPAVIDHRP